MPTIVSGPVLVETKPAWFSKINWTQGIGMLASLVTLFTAGKYNVPPEVTAGLIAGINGLQGIVTWMLRTFFTTAIIPASLPQ
jgi:hypothetical protein